MKNAGARHVDPHAAVFSQPRVLGDHVIERRLAGAAVTARDGDVSLQVTVQSQATSDLSGRR